MLGEPGAFAPTEVGGGINIRKTIAEQEDIGCSVGLPGRSVGELNGMNLGALGQGGVGLGEELKHGGQIAGIFDGHRRLPTQGRSAWGGGCEFFRKSVRHGLHRGGSPVGIGFQILREGGGFSSFDQEIRGIENLDAGLAESGEEWAVGDMVWRRRVGLFGEGTGFHHRLHRDG